MNIYIIFIDYLKNACNDSFILIKNYKIIKQYLFIKFFKAT